MIRLSKKQLITLIKAAKDSGVTYEQMQAIIYRAQIIANK